MQLDPTFNIPSSWPPTVKRIAEALQTYGAYVNDRGGSVSIQGENDIGRGYPTRQDRDELDVNGEFIRTVPGKISDLTDPGDKSGSDSIDLEHDLGNDPFPLDRLSVIKITENTGQGSCPAPGER